MTDEYLSYDTNLNSRDGYNINVGLYGGSRGGKRRTEDNVAAPDVHQRGEGVLPLPNLRCTETRSKKDMSEWSFKDHRHSTWAPIARGANVQNI